MSEFLAAYDLDGLSLAVGIMLGAAVVCVCFALGAAWDRAGANLDRLLAEDDPTDAAAANEAFYESRSWGERR